MEINQGIVVRGGEKRGECWWPEEEEGWRGGGEECKMV